MKCSRVLILLLGRSYLAITVVKKLKTELYGFRMLLSWEISPKHVKPCERLFSRELGAVWEWLCWWIVLSLLQALLTVAAGSLKVAKWLPAARWWLMLPCVSKICSFLPPCQTKMPCSEWFAQPIWVRILSSLRTDTRMPLAGHFLTTRCITS